jgi:UDP-glucose 4-epimerase
MYKSILGEPITIFGSGEQTRAFSYIDDCVEYFWKCGVSQEASKQIFNIGGLKEYTINEAAKLVSSLTGNSNIIHLEQRHEVKHAWVSHKKAQEILGFDDSKTSLYDGLKKMWEWSKKQPIRKQFVWPEYELEMGLYDYWKR